MNTTIDNIGKQIQLALRFNETNQVKIILRSWKDSIIDECIKLCKSQYDSDMMKLLKEQIK